MSVVINLGPYQFQPFAFTVDNTYLYTSGANGGTPTILRYNIDTSSNPVVFVNPGYFGNPMVFGLSFYNNYIYYIYNNTGNIGEFWRVNANATPGSTSTGVSSADNIKYNNVSAYRAYGLIVVKGYAFITYFAPANNLRILDVSSDSNAATNVCTDANFSNPQQLAVDNYNNCLYIVNSPSGSVSYINQIDISNVSQPVTKNTNFVTLPYSNAMGITVDITSTYLYVSYSNSPYITQVDINTAQVKSNIWASTSSSGSSGNNGILTYGKTNMFCLNQTYSSYPLYKFTIPYIEKACFKEDTLIFTATGYKPVQELRKGNFVKTLLNGFVKIDMIGKRTIVHKACVEDRIKDQLYKCSPENFKEIFQPLIITGCHSILVDDFVSEEQKEKAIDANKNRLCITDHKYRLPACVDERTTVYEIPGTYTIYHLALENDDYYMNYGIYANGLLVESCSKRYIKELSGMEIIK